MQYPIAGSVVRGRIYDETKPSSFNQLWSPEEQVSSLIVSQLAILRISYSFNYFFLAKIRKTS